MKCVEYFMKSLFNGHEITVTLAIRQLYFEIERQDGEQGWALIVHFRTTKKVNKTP